MKHKDHRLLAEYLMSLRPNLWKTKARRSAFLLGSVLPDYNPFTYLRGVRESRGMAGHNHPYSERQILRMTKRLREKGVKTLRDCYTLGAAVHYLSDSFTYPHTMQFGASMREHNRYERELSGVFGRHLLRAAREPLLPVRELGAYLRAERFRYERLPSGYSRDARHILSVCRAVYLSILQEKHDFLYF